MPTVLITGLNGFVAVHTALVYLANGWNVRGTFRSQPKADKTLALPVWGDAVKQGKIQTIIIEDLVRGDFSEALEGVEVVAHCASPLHFNGKTWAEYRDPAVKGTIRVLEQAAKVPSVKGIAVLSSFVSICNFRTSAPEQAGKVYTETDWNPVTEEDCEKAEKYKIPTAPIMWYQASKKYAELAARGVEKRLNPSWTLTTVCPPMIFGPILHYGQATADELKKAGLSTTLLVNTLVQGKDGQLPGAIMRVWADVRNVAQALYEGPILANTARKNFPELEEHVPLGKPDEPTPLTKGSYALDGSKAERELGIKYISLEEMVNVTVKQFVHLGAVRA